MINKHLKLSLILLCTFALLALLAPTVRAAESILPACVTEGYCTLCDVMELVINFGKFLLGIVGSLALLMFVYGGFTWLTSGGESGKIDAGKKILINSVIGIAITFFAYIIVVFVVNALTASSGWKWDTKLTCAPLAGLEPPKVEDRAGLGGGGGATPSQCQDDMTKPCGENYKDAAGNACIGEKCDNAALTCVETKPSTTPPAFTCRTCVKDGLDCAINSECCSTQCTAGKCKSSQDTVCAYGTYCDGAKPCPTGFKCSTNWANTCGTGELGIKCAADSECNLGKNYFCSKSDLNTCSAKLPWARCNSDAQCPSGTHCKGGNYCSDEGPKTGWNANHCKVIGTLHGEYNDEGPSTGIGGPVSTEKMCIPDNVPCLCDCNLAWVFGANGDADCQGVTYAGTSAPFCAYDNHGSQSNYCSPGTTSTRCNANGDCASKYCNTENSNICTQGKIGEGCKDGSQCASGKCYKNTCVHATTPPCEADSRPPEWETTP